MALTWNLWSLYRRNRNAELFAPAFAQVHTDLATDIGAVVDQALSGEPVTVGQPAHASALSGLDPAWDMADTFTYERDDPIARELVRDKYGSERFSLYTGHDTGRGNVIGHIALPFDTIGYEYGLRENLQASLNITLLGLYNSVGGSSRWQLIDSTPTKVSLEAFASANIALAPQYNYTPKIASFQGGAAVIVSHRPSEITYFVRLGSTVGNVYWEFDAFENLRVGRLLSLSASPGLEIQLTSTVLLAAQIRGSTSFQGGDTVSIGPLGSVLLVPQIALGLR